MLEKLLSIDTEMFHAINSCRSTFADWFFSIFSAHITIGIVVTLLTFYIMYKYKFKHFWLYILVIGLCFLLADRISVVCFKDVFCRLRPSHALNDAITVKLKHYSYLIYDNKGGLYGFVSSHAANTFTIITAMILILKKGMKEKCYSVSPILYIVLIVWGLLTGISRIYCGYHYPADVLCGSILGVILGFVVYGVYKLALKILEK